MVLLIFCIILIIPLWMIKLAFENNILKKELRTTQLDDVTVFFITDIHKRKIPNKFFQKLQQEKIDFVFIGGDLAEKNVPISRIERNLSLLTQLGPTYFVMGNNDYELDLHLLESTLKKYNITILNNGITTLVSKTNTINLIGLDELKHSRQKLEKTLFQLPSNENYTILLCHNPVILAFIKEEDPIDLIICGHTHGGQIRFFGYGLYKQGGWEKMKNKTVLVSNGYGTTLLPMRLGAKVQTHLIQWKKL